MLVVLNNAAADSNKVNAQIKLSRAYISESDYQSALSYSREAETLSRTLDFKKGEGDALNTSGIIFYFQGNYPEALTHYLQALHIRELLNDHYAVSGSYNNIGLIHYNQREYDNALDNFNSCLKIKLQIADSAGIAMSYNNIGNVYLDKKNFPEAERNYLASLKIKFSGGDKEDIATSYDNLGMLQYKLGEYLRKKGASSDSLHAVFSEAIKYFNLVLSISEELGDQAGVATANINLGDCFNSTGRINEAYQSLHAGLSIAKKIGHKEYIRDAFAALVINDSLRGAYKEGLDDFKFFILYRDSLLNDANIKKNVQLQMQFNFDKESTADSITNAEHLNQEKLQHEQEIQQQQTYTIGGVIGFALMLVVAIVSFRAFRNKKKANEIISHQKELVEEKQKEILDSIRYAKRIQQSLLPTEKYIAARLHGSRINE